MTDLETNALATAGLITSYSPTSAWATQSPSHYALFLHHALHTMLAAGIVPEDNINCWFWQIDSKLKGCDNSERIAEYRKLPAPKFSGGLFRNDDGSAMSDYEFRAFFQKST